MCQGRKGKVAVMTPMALPAVEEVQLKESLRVVAALVGVRLISPMMRMKLTRMS